MSHQESSGLAAVVAALSTLAAVAAPAPAQCRAVLSDRWINLDSERDEFGMTVAIDGDVAMWGTDFLYNATGQVHVARRDASGRWNVTQTLFASDEAPGNDFGQALAMENGTAVVGALGAVYVFRSDADGQWTEVQKLLAPDESLLFGEDVAIHGDIAVVGQAGDHFNDRPGAAHVYRRNGSGQWEHVQQLASGDALGEDGFGESLAIWNDTILVGAPADDEVRLDSGAVYVFGDNGNGHWEQTAKLAPPDLRVRDNFGFAIDLQADTAAIGAFRDDHLAYNSGSVYIYHRDGSGRWRPEQKIAPFDGSARDRFGNAVDLDGRTLVVGAETAGNSIYREWGAVYIYVENDAGDYVFIDRLRAEDAANYDLFGHAVATSEGRIVIGAPLADTMNSNGAGFVHFAEFDCAGMLLYRTAGGCPGPSAYEVASATPASPVALIFGIGQGATTIPGGPCAGTVLDVQNSVRLVAVRAADDAGRVVFDGDIPPTVCGAYLQAVDLSTCVTTNIAGL